jgi:uncharacterized protein (DUF1330 family)
MKYYVTVALSMKDDAWVGDYLKNVTELVHKFGGKYLARTGNIEHLEGTAEPVNLQVIIEWPSKDAAESFYNDPAYRPYRDARQAGSDSELYLVAGEDIAAG